MRGMAAVVWVALVAACGGRAPPATIAPQPPEAPSPPDNLQPSPPPPIAAVCGGGKKLRIAFYDAGQALAALVTPARRSAHPDPRRRIAKALRGVQAVERAGARGPHERSRRGRQDRSAVEHPPAFRPPGRGAGRGRGVRDCGLRGQRPPARHRRRRRCRGSRALGRRVDHADRARQRHRPALSPRRREAHRHRAALVAEGLNERSECVLDLAAQRLLRIVGAVHRRRGVRRGAARA